MESVLPMRVLIKENMDFKELLWKKTATQKNLQRARSKIEMRFKRRVELLTEETVLKKKLEKDNWVLFLL